MGATRQTGSQRPEVSSVFTSSVSQDPLCHSLLLLGHKDSLLNTPVFKAWLQCLLGGRCFKRQRKGCEHTERFKVLLFLNKGASTSNMCSGLQDKGRKSAGPDAAGSGGTE